jgi:hypothetical protein
MYQLIRNTLAIVNQRNSYSDHGGFPDR